MKTFCFYFLFNEYEKLIKKDEKEIKNKILNKINKDNKITTKEIDPFYLNYLHNFFIIY